MLHPQIVKGAALVDAEQQLVRIGGETFIFQPGHLRLAAGQPAHGALTAGLCIVVLGGVLHALIEGHGNGGTEIRLDLHALFRAHEDLVAVQMGMEGHALFGDVAQLGETEHLESAAVGEDGAVPAGELVQAAQLCHQLVPRTQVQVVGVAQHHLAANVLQVKGGQTALDGGGGGHVHERGRLHRAVHRFKLPPACGVLGFDQAVRHV